MPRKMLTVNREYEKTSLRYKVAVTSQISLISFLLALYLVITPTSVTARNFAGFEVGDFQSQFSEVHFGKDLPPENGTSGSHSLSTNASTSSPFTVIALPDTQHYTDSPGREVIFNSQTTWAVNSQSVRNIVFLTHLGDLTENGGEDFDDNEWIIVDTAMSILERTADPSDDLPFGVTPGNHDTIGGTMKFEEWFGVARFSGRSYYGGHYGSDNLNSYGLFSASGLDFILIHIDSSDSTPSAGALEWADGLLKADINRRGIVVTHRPLGSTGNPASFSAAGQAIYDALKDNPNFFLMLGGHLNGEGQRQDTFDGHTVYTLLSDYQGRSNGGDGWLRIMEFQPANNQIQVYTYTPYHDEFETDANSQFTLSYDMTGTTPPPPPSTPVLNSISNPDQDGAYTVSWGSVSGAVSYELQEQYDSGSWSAIYTGTGLSQDLDGKADGSWCYQVRASNAGGSSGRSSSQCTTVATSLSPPDTPTLNSISNPDQDGAYTVSWGSVSGAVSYELQEQFDSGSWSTIYTGVSTSQDLSGKADGIWCYQVRASNVGGSSGWSSSQCTTVATQVVTTEPPPHTTEPPTTEPPPATTEPPGTTEPPPATTEPPPQVTPSPTLPPTPSHTLFIPIILVH